MLLLTTIGCTSPKVPQSTILIEQYPPIFPPYQDSIVIPPNIAPLNFVLPDTMEDAIVVVEGYERYVYNSNDIKIFPKRWRKFCKPNTTIKITVHYNGKQYKPLHWFVSQDSIDPYIVYRLVLPTDGAYQTISLNERTLSNFKTRPIMQNTQQKGNCFNCHSFQNFNSSKYTLQLRNPRGLLINGRDVETPETKDEGLLYSSWHPQKEIIAFLQGGRIPIDFFMPSDDTSAAGNAYFYNQVEINTSIVIYNLKTNKWKTITTDTTCEYSYPTWHPNGKTLYFTRSTKKPLPHRQPESPDFLTQYSFDLAYIHYNPQTEQFGDSIYTLIKASDFATATQGQKNGSFGVPRVSPDGKMLVASFSAYAGNPIRNNSVLVGVTLAQQNAQGSGSHLYLFASPDGEGKKDVGSIPNATPARPPHASAPPQRQTPAPPHASKSWPTFSTNSKWLMFVSKQIDGYFTQVWFAHIDTETGRTSTAFPLPQATGNAYKEIPKAFNLPEFSTTPTEF